jgi:undecaprenyl-diphosphatase
MKKKHSIAMGIAQGLAIFPGISRSGSTICTGIVSGCNKEIAAKHSFLISLPIIFGSMIIEVFSSDFTTTQIPIIPLFLSFIVAFICGVASLKFMMKFTCKTKFRYFGYYLILISIISLLI